MRLTGRSRDGWGGRLGLGGGRFGARERQPVISGFVSVVLVGYELKYEQAFVLHRLMVL